MRVDRPHLGLAAERHGARQAPEQDAPQRVDVGPAVHVLSPDLLWSHVVHGADELASPGQPRPRVQAFRHPEVREVHPVPRCPPLRGEQDVRRLHVPVDQTLGVGGVQGGSALGDDRHCPGRLQLGHPSEQPLEVGSLHVAHGQVEDPVGLPRVVDRDHVGVIEACSDPGLPDESLPEGLVLGHLGVEDLQGHLAVQAEVLGQVHHCHSPAADDRKDPVAGQFGSDPGIGSHGPVVTLGRRRG